jgi:hypothetical protein
METGMVSKTGIYFALTQVIENNFACGHNKFFKFRHNMYISFVLLEYILFVCH